MAPGNGGSRRVEFTPIDETNEGGGETNDDGDDSRIEGVIACVVIKGIFCKTL
jgi:hypothetical protein